jgi:hypothetical protein
VEPRRRQLIDGLTEGLSVLAESGCQQVWLNGSFVTSKEEPGDFDCVWDTAGVPDPACRSEGRSGGTRSEAEMGPASIQESI